MPVTELMASRADAKKRGLARYFTGIACCRGHIAERLVSTGHCVKCNKERNATHAHKEQCVALTKKWRAKNREHIRKYIAQNAKKAKEYRDRYRNKNRKLEAARSKAYRLSHPERKLIWDSNRRARKSGSIGRHDYADIRRIFKAQRGRCAYCRINLKFGVNVDHIVPLAKRGSNDAKNLQLLCPSCNRKKYDKDPVEFARSLGRLV